MANETVLFKRGDSATITSTPVTDGQILFDTSGNGKMYLDNGTDRLEMGGAITVDASLSKTSTNAIQNKAVTGNILNSLAEVSAATQQNTIAGALALKEVNSSLADGNMSFSIGEDSEPYVTYKVGADSVTKKLGSGELKSFGSTYIGNTNAVTILTIPKNGTLLIAATISNKNKVYQAGIGKNGTLVSTFSQGVNVNSCQVAWSGAVNKGDNIQLWAQGNSNNANNYGSGSYVLL